MRFSKFYYAPKPKPMIDDQMANTLLMCDPDHVKAQEWMKRVKQ